MEELDIQFRGPAEDEAGAERHCGDEEGLPPLRRLDCSFGGVGEEWYFIDDMMKNECWTWARLLGHGGCVPGQLSRVSCRCG